MEKLSSPLKQFDISCSNMQIGILNKSSFVRRPEDFVAPQPNFFNEHQQFHRFSRPIYIELVSKFYFHLVWK